MFHFCQDELMAIIYSITYWKEIKSIAQRLYKKVASKFGNNDEKQS